MFRIVLPLALCAALAAPAEGFVTLRRTAPDDAALRWSAANHAAIDGVGLYDGIQVAIEPGFATKLAQAVTGHVDPADVADINGALAASFRAWESAVLRFDITFDGAVERGEELGSEIDVFLVPETDAVFNDNNYFGVTFTESARVEDRLLTNGTVSPGPAITGADIFINETILAGVAPALTRPQQLAALQRLMMHEIGHALGFHHPNEFPQSNYDTDSDPLNVMHIDPDDPTAGLQLSPNVNPNSVVSNRPGVFEALFFTSLQHDERGGRDVLYPLHAPACPGDCNDDPTLAVKELGQSVNIALEHDEVGSCLAADEDHDTRVRVDELVGAVRNALSRCAFDRRIVKAESTTGFLFPLERALASGTIRFAVRPTWTSAESVIFAEILGRPSTPRIQIAKLGGDLRFTLPGSVLSLPIDDWTRNAAHEITATWSRTSATLYVDGELVGTQQLTEPVVTQPDQYMGVVSPFGKATLEDYVFFGRE